jgi:hypothetical protein
MRAGQALSSGGANGEHGVDEQEVLLPSGSEPAEAPRRIACANGWSLDRAKRSSCHIHPPHRSEMDQLLFEP